MTGRRDEDPPPVDDDGDDMDHVEPWGSTDELEVDEDEDDAS